MNQNLVVALLCFVFTLVNSQFACPGAGSFPNRNSKDCKEYFACLMQRGRLTSFALQCPEEMRFNWNSKVCVPEATYSCPNQADQPPAPFRCLDQGNYPDERSLDCSGYYYCRRAGATPMEISCPHKTFFNWKLGKCDQSSLVGCPASAPEFVCPGVGDWLNHESRNCETYIQCFRHYDGTIRHNLAFCPVGQTFDFIRRRCRPTPVAACPK